MPDLDAPRSDTGTAQHGKTRWRTVVARHQAPLDEALVGLYRAQGPERLLVVTRTAQMATRLRRSLPFPNQVRTLGEVLRLAGPHGAREDDLVPDRVLCRFITEVLPERYQGREREHMARETLAAIRLFEANRLRPPYPARNVTEATALVARAHRHLLSRIGEENQEGRIAELQVVPDAARGPLRPHDLFPHLGHIAFIGLDHVSPAEQAALEALARTVDEVSAFVVGRPPRPAPTSDDALMLSDGLIDRLTRDGALEDLGARGGRAPLLGRLFSLVPHDPVPLPSVHVVRPHDRRTEVEETLARVIDELDQGVAAERIAIVVPSLDQYVGRLRDALVSHGIPFSASHTDLTRHTPSGVLLDRILDACDAIERPLAPMSDADALLDLLAHPLVGFRVERQGETGARTITLDVARLERRLRARGLRPVGRAAWEEAFEVLVTPDPMEDPERAVPSDRQVERVHDEREVLLAFHDRLEALVTATSADAFFAALGTFLESVRVPRRTARAAHGGDADRILAGHRQTLALIDRAAAALPPEASGADARTALSDGLWQERDALPPSGDLEWGVQLLDARNVRRLVFDRVHLLGVDQDRFPGPRRAERVQRLFHDATGHPPVVLDPEVEARAILHGILADTTGRVTISVPREEEGAPLVPSVLVAELQEAYRLEPLTTVDGPHRSRYLLNRVAAETGAVPVPTPAGLVAARTLVAARRDGLDPSPYTGHLDDPVLAKELADAVFLERISSASLIERYAQCAFAGFLRHGLGVREPDVRDGDVTPLDEGRIVHRILDLWVGRLIDMGAEPFVPHEGIHERAMATLVGAAVDTLAPLPRGGPAWGALHADLLGGIAHVDNPYRAAPKGHLARLLEKELADGVRVLASEAAFGEDDDGPLVVETPEGTLRFRGRIDRIDLMGDGERAGLRVVDYKTGRSAPKSEGVFGGVRFQLPLYLLAAQKMFPGRPLVLGGYYVVGRDGEPGLAKASSIARADDEETFDRLLDEDTPRRLAAIVRGARQGHHPLTWLDKEAPCGHCAYRRVCGLRPHVQRLRRARIGAEEGPLGHVPEIVRGTG